MTIAAILARKGNEVVRLKAGATVMDAISMLARHRIGAIPVVAGSAVLGILSERDVVYCLDSHGREVLDWTVDRVMTAPPVTVTADVPVIVALSQMSARRIRHLPVVDGDALVGIVSIGDLVAHRIRGIEQETDAMRAYIQGG